MPLLATSGFIVVTSEVPELLAVLYSIFSRHILSKPEATCRLPQTLIIYMNLTLPIVSPRPRIIASVPKYII